MGTFVFWAVWFLVEWVLAEIIRKIPISKPVGWSLFIGFSVFYLFLAYMFFWPHA